MFIIQLFLSCEKDLYEDNIQNSSKELKLSRKPFKELLLLESFNKAYEKIKSEKQKNILAKSALEEEFNFTIVEGRNVNIIEKDGKIFFNILIERAVKDSLYFENLVLKIAENEDMEGFIAKYNKNNLNAIIPEDGDFEITTITQRYNQNCFNVCIIKCYDLAGNGEFSVPHALTSSCAGNNVGRDCFPYCEPSNPTYGYPTPNNDGSSSGGGGSGSGAGTPPPIQEPENQNGASNGGVIVYPVFELEDEIDEPIIDPCDDLKNIMKNSGVRSRFNGLNTPQMFNRTYETAYAETKTGNARDFALITSQSGSSNHVNFPSSLNIISFMHVHNNDYTREDLNGNQIFVKTAKSPSAQDLMTFIGPVQIRANQQSVSLTDTYGMTISSLGIFCFKMKVNTLPEVLAVTSNGIDWKKFEKDCNESTKKISEQNLTVAQKLNLSLQKILKMMKDNGLDQIVGLYEGTATTNGTLTTLNWKEKVLDANNALTEIPCIN